MRTKPFKAPPRFVTQVIIHNRAVNNGVRPSSQHYVSKWAWSDTRRKPECQTATQPPERGPNLGAKKPFCDTTFSSPALSLRTGKVMNLVAPTNGNRTR